MRESGLKKFLFIVDPHHSHKHHHSSQRHLTPTRPRSELFHHPLHREQRSNTIHHVTPKLVVTSHHSDGESDEGIMFYDAQDDNHSDF